jgi:hypothetical protein
MSNYERNRPRGEDNSAVDRNRRRRQRVVLEGGWRVEVLLDPPAARALSSTGASSHACLPHLLIDATNKGDQM